MGVRHRAGVIGQPVAHSLSPVLHRAVYEDLGLEDWEYVSREVAPDQLEELLARLGAPAGEAPSWEGLSVTMPHKQRLLTLVDVVDPLAQTVGAANTVVAQRSGTGPALLAAFNTDVAGIVGALREAASPAPAEAETALVLGSGATACSALAALAELGARRIVVAARQHAGPGRALAAAHRMGLEVEALTWRPQDADSCRQVAQALLDARLAVSTLPAGAADALVPALRRGASQRGPLERATLLDVVYDPWPTALAAAWQQAGGAVAPGWLMLLHQAVPQVRLMTGHLPDTQVMRRAVERALAAR
nr:shikimate dehydrogenase [Actinomyces sp.]